MGIVDLIDGLTERYCELAAPSVGTNCNGRGEKGSSPAQLEQQKLEEGGGAPCHAPQCAPSYQERADASTRNVRSPRR